MLLTSLSILNYKNIRDASLTFSPKVNCLVGLNGQGKTNVLDAIYLLSFTKSAFSVIDSQNITHDENFAMVQGEYQSNTASDPTTITCGIKRGAKKTFKRGQKAYTRLLDHIGLIPLVMVSPEDNELIAEGSDERRRFMDSVISQYSHRYLEDLTAYNTLLKNRNATLKQLADAESTDTSMLEVYEYRMVPLAERIYSERSAFISAFVPLFNEIYSEISGHAEQVSLRYISQLQDRNLAESLARTRQRDLILGWTSQGIHKDDIEMLLDTYPLKRVGSQGQQKTYLLAMKLAQALYLSNSASSPTSKGEAPLLLLDDIFDKLDNERVERIIRLVNSDRFGQIFITDTDRQHLTDILGHIPNAKTFYVSNGQVTTDNR